MFYKHFLFIVFLLQVLQEAFTRCVSVLGSSSKPEELSVQVTSCFHGYNISVKYFRFLHVVPIYQELRAKIVYIRKDS